MRTLGSNSAISNLEDGKITFESTTGTCTVAGTLRKTFLMLLVTVAAGVFVYTLLLSGNLEMAMGILGVSFIGSFIMYIALFFNGGRMHPFFYLLFAAFQGAMFGALAMYLALAGTVDATYAGIFSLAIILTLGYVGGLFFLYYIGLVRTSEKIRSFGVALGLGIILSSIVFMIISLFSGPAFSEMLYYGPIGIFLSSLYLLFYSIFLIGSFEQIEMSTQAGLPARAEWYLAFSLFHIIIEIFRTILRILIQIAGSSD